MRKILFILLLIPCFFGNAKNIDGDKLIKKCLIKASSFENFTGSWQINRAYIITHDTNFEIILTKGASGSFEKQNLNFETILYCVVTEELKVKLLAKSLKVIYFSELPEVIIFNNKVVDEIEFLYLRDSDGNFIFKNSQELNDNNFFRHNPNQKPTKPNESDTD